MILSSDGFRQSFVCGVVIRDKDDEIMDEQHKEFGYVSILLELLTSHDHP